MYLLTSVTVKEECCLPGLQQQGLSLPENKTDRIRNKRGASEPVSVSL